MPSETLTTKPWWCLRIYSWIHYGLIPVILLRLLLRSLRNPAYRQRIGERFGFIAYSSADLSPIWLHAGSVGELNAARGIIDELLKTQKRPICITTITPTGSSQVKKLYGNRVEHYYLPLDVTSAVKRFLRRTQPCAGIIMETDLWPNLLYHCARQNIPICLANARLSARSARRYTYVAKLIKPALKNISLVCSQDRADARRFARLGVAQKCLSITGNIKWDATLPPNLKQKATALKKNWQSEAKRVVWVAGSVHYEELKYVLQAHLEALKTLPTLLLVVVLRHPEHATQTLHNCQTNQLKATLYSSHQPITDDTQVIIGDTFGDMLLFYGAADMAFVGGSLIPHGGHNLVEPALWGIPVLSGPHTFNFAAMTKALKKGNGLTLVNNSKELGQQLSLLWHDQAKREAIGENARQIIQHQRGVLARLNQKIDSLLASITT